MATATARHRAIVALGHAVDRQRAGARCERRAAGRGGVRLHDRHRCATARELGARARPCGRRALRALPAGGDGRDDRAVGALDLALRVTPPIERPHAVYAPAELDEALRTQAVALAHARGMRIASAVVLDREDEALGVVRIDDGEL